MSNFWTVVFSNAIVATLLAIAVTFIGRVLKNPAAIHLMWMFVLFKLFAPALLVSQISILPHWTKTDRRETSSTRTDTAPFSDRAERRVDADEGPVEFQSVSAVVSSGSAASSPAVRSYEIPPLSMILATVWFCGTIFVIVRYSIQIGRFAKLVRQFEPADSALQLKAGRGVRATGDPPDAKANSAQVHRS